MFCRRGLILFSDGMVIISSYKAGAHPALDFPSRAAPVFQIDPFGTLFFISRLGILAPTELDAVPKGWRCTNQSRHPNRLLLLNPFMRFHPRSCFGSGFSFVGWMSPLEFERIFEIAPSLKANVDFE